MSSLFLDTDVWGVSITLTHKSGSGTRTINVAFDYWAAATIFTSNGVFYPLLVEPPPVRRTCGRYVWVRQDIAIRLYAKTDFEEHGKSLLDVLQNYEINGAPCIVYYWSKPRDAVGAHVEDTNRRMVVRVVSTSYDDVAGILTLQARDTSYEEKELAKEMTALDLPGLVETADGAVGGTVFGEASASATRGLFLNAPVFDSYVDNASFAKAFTGWTFDGHDMKDAELWVRNSLRTKSQEEWLRVALTATPESPTFGEADLSDIGFQSARFLSQYSRGMAFTVTGDSPIITCARSWVRPPTTFWAADFNGTDAWLGCPSDRGNSISEDGFTLCGWFYLDSKATTQTLVSKYAGSSRRDYELFYDQPADRFKFQVYNSSGTSIGTTTASTLGSPSTATWYFITCKYDPTSSGNEIKIQVNNGTTNSAASSGTPGASSAGFRIGARRGGQYFNGRAQFVAMWDVPYDTASIYNSGAGTPFDELTDTDKADLIAWYDLCDLAGKRKDAAGNNDLKAQATMAWAQGHTGITVEAKHGELTLALYFAKLNDTTGTYEPEGNPLRQIKLDIEDGNIQSGVVVPYFIFEPPLPLEAGVYFAELTWSGQVGGPYSMMCNYGSAVGEVLYYKDRSEREAGWKASPDTRLDLEFYTLGEDTDAFVPSTAAAPFYSYWALRSKAMGFLTGGQVQNPIDETLQFKALVAGLQDDGSGTYTGSAGALIQYPADIARFLLLHPDLLGVASGDVDTSSLTSVRASQAAAALKLRFVVDSSVGIRETLVELCRQGRMQMYKKGNGDIAFRYPNYTTIADVVLSEGEQRGDLLLNALDDAFETEAANDWHIFFDRDYLGIPDALEWLRAARSDKFFQMYEATPNGSTDSDSFREAMLQKSYAIYGSKQNRDPLDYHDDPTTARLVAKYHIDRWHLRARRFTIRVPMRLWYATIGLFSKIEVAHSGLPHVEGTTFTIRADDSDYRASSYYEGTPLGVWSGGRIMGEVVDVAETGGFMTLTIETLLPFSNT